MSDTEQRESAERLFAPAEAHTGRNALKLEDERVRLWSKIFIG
jgi:hypothetical protein